MIRKVYTPEGIVAEDVPALMQDEGIPFETVDVVNWPGEYPYKPRVEFAIAHTRKEILLDWRVVEETSRAAAGEDLGRVWEDSCVEFFCSPDPSDGLYYNLECNCIGKVLLACAPGRHDREKAPAEVLKGIRRWSSIGSEPFAERAEGSWEVCLIIPVTAFFKHSVESFDGLQVRGNFYKCGDLLRTPHYLSYAPIDTPKPDFHRPEFFIPISFE